MTTVTQQNSDTTTDRAVRKAVQTAIKLKATTAAVCGSALKRWSIVWSN